MVLLIQTISFTVDLEHISTPQDSLQKTVQVFRYCGQHLGDDAVSRAARRESELVLRVAIVMGRSYASDMVLGIHASGAII